MASIVVTQGKTRTVTNALAVGTASGGTLSTTRWLQTVAVDDSTVAIAAGDTAANSGGAITNFVAKPIDAANTQSNNVGTMVMTISDTSFDTKTVKRITVHDQVNTSVTASSTTLFGGVDGQSILKVANVNLKFTLTVTVS
jgi:hypothetical protein